MIIASVWDEEIFVTDIHFYVVYSIKFMYPIIGALATTSYFHNCSSVHYFPCIEKSIQRIKNCNPLYYVVEKYLNKCDFIGKSVFLFYFVMDDTNKERYWTAVIHWTNC